MIFKRNKNPELLSIRRTGAPAAVVFLHGFSGDARNTWGEFPVYLAEEPRLARWDIHSLGYSSHLRVDLQGIWSADPGLDVLALQLRTALSAHPLHRYRAVAIIAHSMGGLIAQRALLDAEIAEQVSHLFLFGTPSDGLKKAAFGSWLKPQVRDMAKGSPFLSKLRGDWKRLFGTAPPFSLKVVAGDLDQFVPSESSLSPFPDAVQAVIPGDHLSMVKPSSAAALGVSLVIEGLCGTRRSRDVVESARLAVERKEFLRAIELLLPRVNELDPTALVQLALALDGCERGDEALALLDARYLGGTATATDVMGVLAGRLKRRWLLGRTEADLARSRALYLEALNLAEAADDADQAMYHSINIAFLDTLSAPEASAVPRAAVEMARRALAHTTAAKPGHWREATKGEAYLVIGDLDASLVAYRAALGRAPAPREVDSMYTQALLLTEHVFGPQAVERLAFVLRLPTMA